MDRSIAMCISGFMPRTSLSRRNYDDCLRSLSACLGPSDRVCVVATDAAALAPTSPASRAETHRVLTRDAMTELNAEKDHAFISDILDFGAGLGCDVVGYINADILIDADAVNILRDGRKAYAFMCHGIAECTYDDFLAGRVTRVPRGGVDLVAFETDWWQANRGLFPSDITIGEPYWDSYYCEVIRRLPASDGCYTTATWHREHECTHNEYTVGAKVNKAHYHRLTSKDVR